MSKENIIQNIFNITAELSENIKQLDLKECTNEVKEELLQSLNDMLSTLSELSPEIEDNSLIIETEKMLNKNILTFKEGKH